MKEIIAPSVLSMDYSIMTKQLEELNESDCEAIHFDVMDGHFVPNLTFGPDILKGFDLATSKYMDVHLMIDDPLAYYEKFVKAGADQITFHVEAVTKDEGFALIEKIKEMGKDAGITLKPKTNVEEVVPYLDKVNTVLVMTVEPGFGGQVFMEDMMAKVKFFDDYRKANNLNYHLEVDGGINDQTVKIARANGADMFVAGSYIFKHPKGIVEGVNSLK